MPGTVMVVIGVYFDIKFLFFNDLQK
jgi:hypothetical protein